MLPKLISRCLPAITLLGALFQLAPAAGEEGYHPPNSVFRNIGYSTMETMLAAEDSVAPVIDPAPIVESGQQPAPVMDVAPSIDATPFAMQPCTANCSCSGCSTKKKAALSKVATGAYKGVFYANDFSYLNDPCYDGWNCGDAFKGLCHSCFSYDVGGQFRLRMHREENHRGLGLTGVSDDFLLDRTRVYFDVNAGDNVRFYYELINANSGYEAFNPRPIEENYWDIQNLFFDVKLFENSDRKLVGRVGRQELMIGAQRYISPLDWANTRRTFDGARLLYTTNQWDVDGFWTRPLVRDRLLIDDANEDQQFYGFYSTYKGFDSGTVDLYWLAFDNDLAGFAFDSIGGRYNGSLGSMLFEAEGAYQFGKNADGSDHNAGFFVVGAGKAFTDWSCKPTSWLYLDWASGADEQGAGNGHHHFFPLAHKYNGFMDLFGRRNLIDLNLLTTMQLSKKVKLLTWYHSFWLENENDTPYNVNMSAFNPNIAPGDDYLGQEIDAVVSIGIDERSNIQFGYSHFWAGDYFETPGLPFNGDADFFWTQYQRNF